MSEEEFVLNIALGKLKIQIGYPIIAQWVIMIIIIMAVLILIRRFKSIPYGKQAWIELIFESVQNLVKDNMGEEYMNFIPFAGTLAIYLLPMNLTGLFGFKPPTTDYSVALGIGLISFIVINVFSLKRAGILGYIKGYAKPYAFMVPINLIERLIVPVSLSLRLFGNMLAGTIMVELIYKALAYFSSLIKLKIPVLQLIIPIPFHVYFDIFDGVVQMIIFTMLTMIFIKTTSEHE
jgi:F-type H+-transporting ATPase subunit a